jgi:arsenite transporter
MGGALHGCRSRSREANSQLGCGAACGASGYFGADICFSGRFFHVLLIAVPITLQVYFNAGLAYYLMKRLKVEHSVAAPGALIGASNFFELAVATAIALFGPESGAALATVVGVLVEVPVMLSVCSACNRTRHWFPAPLGGRA